MMTSSRLVRGTKGRLFACLGVLTLFAGVIFLYHNARVELDEIRNSFGKCHQDQDSLAAQVQVISEYKKDLEKSLNLEKAEHRQTKEELQSRMNDEQQLRNKENLENVNKYKALQQQYKLLQSEHEDLSEICNKARAQQASCAEALTHLDSQLSTLQHDVASRDAEVNSFKTKFVKLEEENKILLHKLDALQIHLEQLQGGKEKGASSRRSSTKHANIESALGAEDGVGMHEQPLNVLPIAQRSSTVAQEEILQPVRPAQPGLLQSPLSKTLGKQTTTPKINADAVQSQDRALRVIPDLPLPLLLSPMQQHDPVEKQDFANNGPQGVLPAPFSFGNDNHYSQNAVPLQAPYKLHGLGHQDIPQNQGQMPPLAPAPRAAFQNNILPLPLDHAHNYAQHLPHFNQFVHQNLNPFRNDRSIVNHDAMGHQETQVNHPEQSLHKFAHNDDVFHLNGLRTNDALGGLYDSHRQIEIVAGNKAHVAEDNNKPMYQLERAGNAVPFHKNPLKNVNIVPLDGDVNQHSNLEPPGGNTFLDLHNHNVDAAHGKIRGQLAGPHDSHQGGHYNNYQGGDYDKEDPPANNEAEDEDLDQIDYNNEPNQAHPVHQVLPGHQAQKMIHRRLADRHQDGAVVRPR